MPVSGMASRERSVTTRWRACPDKPIPPHIRFGIATDQRIDPVFVPPECLRCPRALAAAVVEGTHITACAQRPLAAAIEDHQLDAAIVLPIQQRMPNRAQHRLRERVQRLGAVHGNTPSPALATDQHLIGNRCAHARSLTSRSILGD